MSEPLPGFVGKRPLPLTGSAYCCLVVMVLLIAGLFIGAGEPGRALWMGVAISIALIAALIGVALGAGGDDG